MTEALWTPSEARIHSTRLSQFIGWVNDRHGTDFDASYANCGHRNYDDLWAWSIESPAAFWASVWSFCDVKGELVEPVVDLQPSLMGSAVLPNASLSYAENLLHGAPKEAPVLILRDEQGQRREIWYTELEAQVSMMQQALRDLGVGVGDRVAGYLPNIPETVIAMLAVTSLGAVWSSCSPDYGLNGLSDRFGQIEPKVLFTADGYHYNGKSFDSLATVKQLCQELPSIQTVVVIPYRQSGPELELADLPSDAVSWDAFAAAYTPQPLTFTPVSFRAPLFILFSSGTTGLPKCIVHTVGGTLLHHLREHQLQIDLKAGDRLLYFTTCGWAMWNWQVSAMASGVTLVHYEGSPFYPDANCLPQIVEEERLTHFGTSAKYLDACAKQGIRPKDSRDFSSLRTLMSTGSPLSADGFRYVYDAWKDDVCLSSISGGTDVIGCFVGGNPIGPVYPGQCQKRQLGMDVQVFNDQAQALVDEPGELVCLNPHPAMPLGFWKDTDNRRYHDAYFDRFDNVWCHGDWVQLSPEGGMVFLGRSDATLNPGGVRIGTAEIYRQIEDIDAILDAVVIGQNWDNDVRVVLFVQMREGHALTDELQQSIRVAIKRNATPRHVPAKIVAVTDIPRTRSGKITELAVRDVVHGRPVKNVEALANPESLALYADIEALQD